MTRRTATSCIMGLAALGLAACAPTTGGPDVSEPAASLSVLGGPRTKVLSTDPSPRELTLPASGIMRLEAWGEDRESGVAATRMRAVLYATCRNEGGMTIVREFARERDNSESNRPPRRNAGVDFSFGTDPDRLCPGGRFDGGEIVATASAVNDLGMVATTPELRIVLTRPVS